MDPTPALVNSLLLPYGATLRPEDLPSDEAGTYARGNDMTPELDLPSDSSIEEIVQWDVDGGETDRGFFCTVPRFARRQPPLRITTSISWQKVQYDIALEEALEMKTFFRAGKWNIHHQHLTKYLCQALSSWSSLRPEFETEYGSLPFGSSIQAVSLHSDFRKATFDLVVDPTTEQSWLSIGEFSEEAGLSYDTLSKMTVAWEDLKLITHPHENISIVEVNRFGAGRSFVFKGLMQDTQYMYHELRLLLSKTDHPNIVSKPPALVLKKRTQGQAGIAGFLLELYSGPTLQHQLYTSGAEISFTEKLGWAQQLTLALLHIQGQPPGYFSDFKPNNILLNKPSGQNRSVPVLLDFEQRGTWPTWAPPEIKYVEYLELLATTSPNPSTRDRYSRIMSSVYPEWSSKYKSRSIGLAKEGYNIAWASLGPQDRAKAQMYAFGKVLWCIFEGLPSPDGPQSVESFLEDFSQDQQFPEFRASPPAIRDLIRRCTAGAPEWGSRHPGVVRDQNRIVPWGKTGCSVTARETLETAALWWREELAIAEAFVIHKDSQKKSIGSNEYIEGLLRDINSRPSLEDTLDILSDL
jgi:serine/threonine protein kinase